MKVTPKKEWSDDEKLVLTRRAKAGDQSAIPDLVDAYIPEAMRSASWYVRRAPGKIDDIFGAGLEGLVVGCTRACNGHLKDDNILKYIKSIVRWAVQDFLRKDFLIPIPVAEFRKRVKAMEKDRVYMNKENKPGADVKTHTNGILEGVAIIVSFENLKENTAFDLPTHDKQLNAVEDLFTKLELTERESRIVSLRMDDYTLQEIGDKVDLSKMRIKQILDDVKVKVRGAGMKENKQKCTGTKVCTMCDEDKSLSDYYKRSDQSRETHKSICKACMKLKREACVSQ
jgi:RNA polymerase sigma factor (sigma-70 family)